jgi:hypothetical protein
MPSAATGRRALANDLDRANLISAFGRENDWTITLANDTIRGGLFRGSPRRAVLECPDFVGDENAVLRNLRVL